MRRRIILATLVVLFGAAAVVFAFAPGGSAQSKPSVGPPPSEPYPPELVARGRTLFVDGCSTCHGLDAQGIQGVAPDLRGVGAQSADFYVRTGRMPLDRPGDQPLRSHAAYPDEDVDALVAYIGSLGGPAIPQPDPASGNVSEGMQQFGLYCAGCHQIGAKGGVVTDAFAPDLGPATPTDIAAAVRIGPYVMPVFREDLISDDELDSIILYVQLTQEPDNAGGWAIGNIGPITEGMVAWFLGAVALLLCARLIGERNEA